MFKIKRKYPENAIGFSEAGLVGVSLSGGSTERAQVYFEEFEKGTFVPDFTLRCFSDEDKLFGSIDRAVKKLNLGKDKRISLTLPDNVFRVFLFEFDDVPSKSEDLLNLFKFRLRKIIPFETDSAVISYQWAHSRHNRQTFMVGVAYKPVLEQFEAAFDSFGVKTGLIDKELNNVINLYSANNGGSRDPLLHVILDNSHMSLMLEVDGEYLMYRGKSLQKKTLKSTIKREILQSVLYWFDRLDGQKPPEVLVHVNRHGIQLPKVETEKGTLNIHDSNLVGMFRDLRYIGTNEERVDSDLIIAPLGSAMRSYI